MFARVWIVTIATVVLAYLPPADAADPYYEADVKANFSGSSRAAEFNTSNTGPVSGFAEIQEATGHARAVAAAGPGYLGISTSTTQVGSSISNADAGAAFIAYVDTGSPFSGVTSFTTFINLSLSGSFIQTLSSSFAVSGGGIQVNVQLRDAFGGPILINTGNVSYFGSAAGLVLQNAPSGLLTGFNGGVSPFSFTTSSFALDSDSEYKLLVSLNSSNQSPVIAAPDPTHRESGMDIRFDHTLTFGPGPVFGGDAPFSINSSGLSIVDNQWVDTRAVPEPETYAMLLAGLSILGFVARRRKQKAA